MQSSNKIFRLEGVVQHYAWGGYEFIPSLLHLSNGEAKPFAEYWMGAHDNAPSEIVVNGKKEKLNWLIANKPLNTLAAQKSSWLFDNLSCLYDGTMRSIKGPR